MELRDGQSERIDRLELREDPGLVAHLLRVQIVGDAEQPMLRPRLARVAGGVELVDGDKRRSTGDGRALHRLLGHGGNGDVLDLHIALLNLSADHLRDKVILVVLAHQLRSEILRQEVVVERILLGDGVAADGVAIVRPIGQIRPHLALAGAVVEVGIGDGLGASHLVDADVAIGNRTVGQREDQSEGSEQENRLGSDDEPAELPLGIVGGIDLVPDLVGEQGLLRGEPSFNG